MNLSPKRIKIVLTCWTLLSIAVGFNGCMRTLHNQAEPKPISRTNLPWHFDIVAFAESGGPVLLTSQFRAVRSDVIWQGQGCNSGQYSFYIPRTRRAEVESILDASLGDTPGMGLKLQILTDNPSAKQQTIRVDYNNDDSSFYSVYTVNANTVTPVKYGDMLKFDGFIALAAGLKHMLIFYIAGRIALAIFQWKTRSQAATGNQVQP